MIRRFLVSLCIAAFLVFAAQLHKHLSLSDLTGTANVSLTHPNGGESAYLDGHAYTASATQKSLQLASPLNETKQTNKKKVESFCMEKGNIIKIHFTEEYYNFVESIRHLKNDTACTPDKTGEDIDEINQSLLKQIKSHKGKINNTMNQLNIHYNELKANAKVSEDLNYIDFVNKIDTMLSHLSIIIEQLNQCINQDSEFYYKTCNFLPSIRIYGLFESSFQLYLQSLIDTLSKSSVGQSFISTLEKLLLDMIRMSNLCNEKYLETIGNQQYACSVRITRHSNGTAFDVLARDNTQGLFRVQKLEKRGAKKLQFDD